MTTGKMCWRNSLRCGELELPSGRGTWLRADGKLRNREEKAEKLVKPNQKGTGWGEQCGWAMTRWLSGWCLCYWVSCREEWEEGRGTWEGKNKLNERFFLSVRELKEGCRLNRDVRTKSSALEVVLLAWIQRSPRESWQRSEEAGGDSTMGRRDDGNGCLREAFKSGKNARGETSFSVSVIQSRMGTGKKSPRGGVCRDGTGQCGER